MIGSDKDNKKRLIEVEAKKILQVVMANKPRMLREMLGKVIGRSSGVNVIGEVINAERLPLIVELLRPDWVVLSLSPGGSLPDIAKVLRDIRPDLGILAITENADRVCALHGDVAREGIGLKDLVSLKVLQKALFKKKTMNNQPMLAGSLNNKWQSHAV